MLLIVALAIVICVWQILRHTPVNHIKQDSDIWPVMERDATWDHELTCRCRTCRS